MQSASYISESGHLKAIERTWYGSNHRRVTGIYACENVDDWIMRTHQRICDLKSTDANIYMQSVIKNGIDQALVLI